MKASRKWDRDLKWYGEVRKNEHILVIVCAQYVWDLRSNPQQRKGKGGFGRMDGREEERTG